jgi:4-diphosphocytidyl-2-C-methyl-D-erythritol kinase
MSGIGDKLGAAVRLPKVFALLVNPQVHAPTREVFAALGLAPGSQLESPARSAPPLEFDAGVFWDVLSRGSNDLVAAAIRVAPAIATVLKRLSQIPEAKATGMSGSGATCFALFGDRRSAAAARRIIAAEHPGWWVEATCLH